MKVLCAICYGAIPTIDVDGAYLHEELGILLGKISRRPLITTMA